MDLSVIRDKIIRGVFRRYTALKCIAVERNVLLLGEMHLGTVQRMPLSHEDLRADDVNTCNDLGDRVLDLHARIHFDEIELAGIDVDQELDGSGVEVAGLASDSDRSLTQFFANRGVKVHGGSYLHHFLMAPLYGAVSLVQMEDVPILIPQDLHFDMLCAPDKTLEEDRVIAERRGGFLPGFLNLGLEFHPVFDDAHAAAASAERSFYDQRETDLL